MAHLQRQRYEFCFPRLESEYDIINRGLLLPVRKTEIGKRQMKLEAYDLNESHIYTISKFRKTNSENRHPHFLVVFIGTWKNNLTLRKFRISFQIKNK